MRDIPDVVRFSETVEELDAIFRDRVALRLEVVLMEYPAVVELALAPAETVSAGTKALETDVADVLERVGEGI